MEIPGDGGSNVKRSEMENPGRWGVKLEKTLRWGGGGFRYFLEPHIMQASLDNNVTKYIYLIGRYI